MKDTTDDRRTTLAVLLCIVVVMFYSEIFLAPVSRQQLQNLPASSSPTSGAPSKIEHSGASAAPSSGQSVPAAPRPSREEVVKSGTLTITTPLLRVTLSQLGGRLLSVRLLNYKEHLNAPEPLEIISTIEGATLPLGIYRSGFSDEGVAYQFAVEGGALADSSVELKENESTTITLTGRTHTQEEIQKQIVLRGDSYLMRVTGRMAEPLPGNAPLALEWTRLTDPAHASQFDIETFTVFSSNKISYITPDEVADETRLVPSVSWVGLGNRYFLSSLVSPDSPAMPGAVSVEKLEQNRQLLRSRLYGSSAEVTALVFHGPKDLEVLGKTGHELVRSVDLGWFSFLAHPLLSLLRFFNGIFNNYGLAIIALTLLIKIGFLPLTRASFHSMKQMSEIQPEIKALRERIKDATELNQAIMKLYKDRGINPLGGCLPIFIQIPVFLGLYNALIHAIELRHAPFALWIQDLSAPEALDVFGIGVPVMVLLFGASMFVQQLQMPSTLDPMQKKIMLAMPVIFTFFFLGFPSGLTLYWLVNNIISIVQQATLKETKRFSPMTVTIFASFMIFAGGYALTLL